MLQFLRKLLQLLNKKQMAQSIAFQPLTQKYLISSMEIGNGGLGRVFLGKQQRDEKLVAVKVSKKSYFEDEFVEILAENEEQTLKSLKGCPNILQYLDSFEKGGKKHLVTELCPKGTLKEKIKGGMLPREQVLGFLRQIAEGYLEISRKNIIHRDIKPSNIFICVGNNLKIADFGFATFESKLHLQKKLSVGSTFYRAPETIHSLKYSQKSDMWSIGVILFEMLTNSKPWHHPQKKEHASLMDKYPIETIMPNEIQNEFKTLLKKLLAYKPEERVSALELLQLTMETKKECPMKVTNDTQWFQEENNSISKQLLNQIDFCRLQYELYKMFCEKESTFSFVRDLKDLFLWNIKRHFRAVEELSFQGYPSNLLRKYRKSEDYEKLVEVIGKYRQSYFPGELKSEDSAQRIKIKSDQCLNKVLEWISLNINESSGYELFLLYDYLISFRWFFSLNFEESTDIIKEVNMSDIVKSLRKEKKAKNQSIEAKHLKQLREKLKDLQAVLKSKKSMTL